MFCITCCGYWIIVSEKVLAIQKSFEKIVAAVSEIVQYSRMSFYKTDHVSDIFVVIVIIFTMYKTFMYL